ncbi:uncharacterized protein FA14DRAFT_160883 [Meira miltonrushii]|uniref:Cytochrome b5 heme-binding domain-containing protein n=1 Tax=Meira miltonrushii TaxID=1280837 RepID=A0A316VEB2_9BASI|nr:uncharacterized protein FA14DRAFT_160883 [Meira miltonrushii]PWN35922.1 hypothetical protein FA14DRAFT_160883 [Meira miltonrushii]
MATLDVPSSPSDTIRPQRRRDTDSSGISEDDVAALRSADIDIDGSNHDTTKTSLPSFSIDPSESSSKPQSSAPSNSAAPKGRGITMSSLRSLLGVPATPATAATSSSAASSSSNGSLATPLRPAVKSNGAGLLGVPPSTTARTAPPGIGGASGASLTPGRINVTDGEDGRTLLTSEIAPKRKKVVLEPGCSALDWARTKQEILAKRMQAGPQSMAMKRITKEELKKHNTREDAWSAFQGKVYDLTPYLKFHPGGKQELMRVAGRDGTRLFSECVVTEDIQKILSDSYLLIQCLHILGLILTQ